VHKPEELSWEECAGIPEVRTFSLPNYSMLQFHNRSQTLTH
jgi:hypothetical protein